MTRRYESGAMRSVEHWVWAVQNRPAVIALLRKVYPLMGLRRRAKIEDLFAEYGEELT